MGALGARCLFSPRKNGYRQNGPKGSYGTLGGALGALGGPSGPFSRSRGVPGASSFGPWGAQRPLQVRAEKSKTTFGSHSGRQPTYFPGKNAFREKAKKNKYEKSVRAKSCSTLVFGGLQNRLFGRPEGPRSPFQKLISAKMGLKIPELYVWLW